MPTPAEIFGAVSSFFRGYSAPNFWPEVNRFLTAVAEKWGATLLTGARCTYTERGRFCAQPGISNCVTCGKTVCFAHGYASMEADVVCFGCVTVKAKPKATRKQRAVPRRRDQLGEAYRVLGLSPTVGFGEVQARFRELAREHHPDKAPARDKARAEARFKKITEAYHFIEAHRRAA